MSAIIAVGLAASSVPAAATEGGTGGAEITFIEPVDGSVRLLVSVPPGAEVDLESVSVAFDGESTGADASLAADDARVERTAVLAIDSSNSMQGAKINSARRAAIAYIDGLPEDVSLGIVSFAGQVTPALNPTTDRAAAREVIRDLELRQGTRLYDGVTQGLGLLGDEGQRSLLVLSDGADTTETPLEDATSAIEEAGVLVDVVALDQAGDDTAALTALAEAGAGEVIPATNQALQGLFSAEADRLSRQILVSAVVPDAITGTEAQIEVSLPTGSGTLTADGFGTVRDRAIGGGNVLARESGTEFPEWIVYAGLGLLGVGIILTGAMLIPAKTADLSVADRISTFATAAQTGQLTPTQQQQQAGQSQSAVTLQQAKEAATNVLQRNVGMEERIAAKLDAAGSQLKPSEWLLVRVGVFVVASLFGILIGVVNIVIGILFPIIGAIAPPIYLSFRQSRRKKAFESQLPDTLQMMSGSLAAGLSLAQSVDTIVREGSEPVRSEFKRALVETRLGVGLEDALDGIVARFNSKDFEWVVMAIRIQRQVGGNLSELLETVAETIRERDYVRRQVAALAAEGKLSAIVLGALPPLFLLYLLATQRDYVTPLFTDPRGLVILIGAFGWLGVGVFWMSRLVKVEV